MLTKPNQTSFKKGQVSNPTGRPKGSANVSTRRFAKIKSLASVDYHKAYEMLWMNMQAGEGWAYQIYFKELVPKKTFTPTILIETKEGESRLEALNKGLSKFTELTYEEILNEIKVLIKLSTETDKNDVIHMSEEERKIELYLLRKVIALKEEAMNKEQKK